MLLQVVIYNLTELHQVDLTELGLEKPSSENRLVPLQRITVKSHKIITTKYRYHDRREK